MPAKFWMTRETFRTTYNIGTGTNSALRNLEGTAENRLYKLDLSNLSVLNIGSVIYSKDKRHVYMYIGYYVSPTGTVIEHAVLQAAAGKKFSNDTLKIQSIDSVLSPYQYGNYEYIVMILLMKIPLIFTIHLFKLENENVCGRNS